jgi:hypothetical protein
MADEHEFTSAVRLRHSYRFRYLMETETQLPTLTVYTFKDAAATRTIPKGET